MVNFSPNDDAYDGDSNYDDCDDVGGDDVAGDDVNATEQWVG